EVRAALAARFAAIAALAAASICLPWLLYSWNYTGQLFPVSGQAVRYLALTQVDHHPTWTNLYGPMLRRAGEVIVRKNALAVIGMGIAMAGIAARLRARAARAVRQVWAPLWPLALYSVLLVVAYTGFVFGYWNFPRYLFPLALLLWAGAFALVDLWARSTPGARPRRALAIGLAMLLIAGSVA